MRLFVAIDLPGALKADLESRVVDPLRDHVPGARWTRPDGRHLTLKFLGEVDEARAARVEDALAAAGNGFGGFTAAFDRVGGFPNLRRPRVVWIGFGAGAERAAALAGRVDDALSPLGFAVEKRAFTAHLTLARFRIPATIGELPAVEVPTEAFSVDEIVLFRSELRREGARYTRVRTFPL